MPNIHQPPCHPPPKKGAACGPSASAGGPKLSDRAVILARLVMTVQAVERDCGLIDSSQDIRSLLRRVEHALRDEFERAVGKPPPASGMGPVGSGSN